MFLQHEDPQVNEHNLIQGGSGFSGHLTFPTDRG